VLSAIDDTVLPRQRLLLSCLISVSGATPLEYKWNRCPGVIVTGSVFIPFELPFTREVVLIRPKPAKSTSLDIYCLSTPLTAIGQTVFKPHQRTIHMAAMIECVIFQLYLLYTASAFSSALNSLA
jgi:uncharacterized membrane protein YozB (DUF420 family)